MNEACLCKVVYSKWKISYIVLITSVQRSKIPPRYQHAISNLNWLTHIMINCHYNNNNNNKEQGKTNGKLRCELSSWSNLFLVHHLKYCCNFSAIKFYLFVLWTRLPFKHVHISLSSTKNARSLVLNTSISFSMINIFIHLIHRSLSAFCLCSSILIIK